VSRSSFEKRPASRVHRVRAVIVFFCVMGDGKVIERPMY